MRTPAWQRVINPQPLSRIAGRTLADSAQIVVQMKDIAEMVVLDFLMSQQDRFGNIHAIDYVYFEKDGKIDKVKKSKIDEGEVPAPAGGVAVKKMILKDNDCGGPQKTNHVKLAGMLDQVRHMSPSLYRHARWLAQNFAAGTAIPKIFVSEALFQQADVDMLRTNLGALDSKLLAACKSGKLQLDVDLADHLAGKGHDPASCDVVGPPKPL